MEIKLCINCFEDIDTSIGGGEVCPSCGYNNHQKSLKGAVKAGTTLAEKYILGRVISANSEGFTYSGFNKTNNTRVRIKEFFPATIAYRDEKAVHAAEGKEELFDKIYKDFLHLTTVLPKLSHVAGVLEIQETLIENNTCYIIYEYIESMTLKTFVEGKGGKLDINLCTTLFNPIINALEMMHSADIKHLGISPQSLRVCKDGKMRLFDFSIEAVRKLGTGLEPDLINGCAAYEQYGNSLECTKATDVYGLSASILYVLTGRLPDSANKRLENPRLMISRETLKIIPQYVISTLAGGLQVMPENRTHDFTTFKQEFNNEVREEVQEQIVQEKTIEKTEKPKAYSSSGNSKNVVNPAVWMWLSFLVTIVILFTIVYRYVTSPEFSSDGVVEFLDNTISAAPEREKVPDLVGESYDTWTQEFLNSDEYQFEMSILSQEFSDEYGQGLILEQTPEADTYAEADTVIKVVLSRGSSKRELPSINGIQFAEALKLLEDEGFIVIKEEAISDQHAVGQVLWYGGDYSSGDVLEYGTEIPVIVSKGSE